jgi:hypothetical protein
VIMTIYVNVPIEMLGLERLHPTNEVACVQPTESHGVVRRVSTHVSEIGFFNLIYIIL